MTIPEYEYDIIFCTLPPLGVDRIYSAPAILKAVVQSDGYRAKCFDFVADLFNFCDKDFETFGNINRSFVFGKATELTKKEIAIKEKLFDHIVQTCLNSQSKYFGFTVFSVHTHPATTELLLRFNRLGLSDRVVLGGRGITTEPWSTVKELLDISDSEFNDELGDIFISRNLVNYVIKGDGEEAILNFLRNNKIENIQHRVTKLVNHYPDYTDYDVSKYHWPMGTPRMDITGSTGCVRDCDFCDVKKQFGKFNYKAGRELAEELIYNQKTYGANEFVFTDSLVNGGMRPFNQFIERMAEYNATAQTPITWSGMFICRDVSERIHNENYYQLLKQSGASGLTIGAESGSNRVLQAMDKKTSVEALFFDLENFRKWKITTMLLTFVGHWSEQHEDFIKQCQMIIKFLPYIRSGTVIALELGTTYKMLRGTPAFSNINIIKDMSSYDNWTARNNRGNTYKTRSQRKLIISKLAYAMNVGVDIQETLWLSGQIESIRSNREQINKFFEKHAMNDNSQFSVISDADTFVKEIIDYKKTFEVKLVVEASSYNGDPNFEIRINNTIVFNKTLTSGEHTIDLCLDRTLLPNESQIEFVMTNKDQFDTKVDDQGNIIADKAILINKLFIDDCDLKNDVSFYRENFYYKSSNSSPSHGLWNNDPLCLDFKLPFVWWYSNIATHNLVGNHSEMFEKQFSGNKPVLELQRELEQEIKTLTI
jgi:hypothetical protein